MCATYIPPETSPYFDDNIFDCLRDDIIKYSGSGNSLTLCGDFNARTSNNQDFITVTDKHNTSDNLTIQIDIQRKSFDPEINSNGQKLIQLCKDNNLRIANGRCFGDSLGKCTFFSTQGNKSLVDYTLVDDSFFKNLDSLIVKPLSYLSDHCQVVTSIKFNNKYEKPAVNTDYQWVSFPKFFKWNSQTSPKEYLDALNSPHYRSKIENFTSAIFPETEKELSRQIKF